MIKRSFSEFHSQKDKAKHKEAMDNLHKEIATVKDIECYMCSIDLETYYQECKDYQELKKKLQVRPFKLSVILSNNQTMCESWWNIITNCILPILNNEVYIVSRIQPGAWCVPNSFLYRKKARFFFNYTYKKLLFMHPNLES